MYLVLHYLGRRIFFSSECARPPRLQKRPEQYAAEGEVDLALLGLGHESDGSWAGELLAAWDSS